ncbi:MAG: flagellar hook-associated protein FlgK [Cellvibrionaceae bacterium]
MGSDVLGVSISGLRASQNAIRTTGHNIANANTEGYSRQKTEINSLGGTSSGIGYLGNGSYTARVERMVNDFVTNQVRQDTSLSMEMNAYSEHILQVNDILANTSTGLTEGLNSFFSALQNVSDDPTSTASRQLLISESENLANRFNTLYTRISNVEDSANEGLETAVNTMNTLTDTVARLNRSISDSIGNSGSIPNDLLDQRDEALRKLSELTSIQVVEQDNQVNVSIGNGLPLITGATATNLILNANEFNPLEPEIYLDGVRSPITDSLSGGEIGGLLDIKNNVISPALNDLGRIGLVIADGFNEIHQRGITLNNNFGENFFRDINHESSAFDRVLVSNQNQTSDQIVSLSITDITQLSNSDYRLSVNSTNNYTVTRLDDNTEVAAGILPGAFPASIEFEGLSFDITSGTFSNGDEFLIQPTRVGARDFSSTPLNPADIALGSPLLTDTNLGNLGSATISAGSVLSLTDSAGVALPLFAQTGQMSPPLVVRFTTSTSYDILDNSDPGNPVQLDPPIRNQVYVPGIENSLFSSDRGLTTVVSNGANLGLPAGSTEVAVGAGVNGYPAETFTLTTTDPDTGAVSSQNVFSTLNDSARTTAGLLDNVDGVSATAFNYLELRDFAVSLSVPLQITANGEDLVEYDAGALASTVPDPAINSGEDFNDYLAEQINENANLSAQGIYAVSAYDSVTSEYYVQLHSTQGDDLTIELEAAVGEVIEVNDGVNADVTMTGAGAGNPTEVLVGGRIDVNLADNIAMTTTPSPSAIFGTIAASTAYLGIQANITGNPDVGDTFTLDFNQDAALDNRNGLALVELQQQNTITGSGAGVATQSYGDSYNRLLEEVGIKTSSAELNREAAEQVLNQTISLRDSVSGVNLDEEAADLIRFEQLYSANAQVINTARELFDRLLNSL